MVSALASPLTSVIARSDSQAESAESATEFECVIEPLQIVKLASPVVGVIARLDVDRGDVVRQGQILGKLQDGVEAATLSLARARARNEYTVKASEARVEFLRRKQERVGELHGKSISSLASLEEVEADTKIAENQREEAELNREIARLEVTHAEEVLGQRTLRSPIDGVVMERLLVPGEYRNEQSPILDSGTDRSAASRSLRSNRLLRTNSRRQYGRNPTRGASWGNLRRHRHRG